MSTGFLNPFRVFRILRLRSALERYRTEPGEKEILALARRLVALGETKHALKYLKAGRARFPGSARLQALHNTVLAQAVGAEIQSLEMVRHQDPGARDLARLIELYRSVREFDRCVELIEEATSAFPEHWVLELAAGKALFHVYLATRQDEYGRHATERLRHAHALNPDSTRALFYLAPLLWELGPREEAQEAIDQLSQIATEDPRAKRLLVYLSKKITSESAGEGPAGPPSAMEAPAPARKPEEDHLATAFLELANREGISGAFIVDSGGKVRQERVMENGLFELTDQQICVATLADSARLAAKRLGMGELRSCVVEGESWWITCAEVNGSSLVVFSDHGFEPGSLGELLRPSTADRVSS